LASKPKEGRAKRSPFAEREKRKKDSKEKSEDKKKVLKKPQIARPRLVFGLAKGFREWASVYPGRRKTY